MCILLLPLNSVNVFPIFWQLKLQKLDPIALSSLHFSLQHSQHCCHSFPCKFMIDWDNWQWQRRCIFTCHHSSCIVTPTFDIAKCQLLKMRWEIHTLSSSQSCDSYDLDISGPSSTDSTPSLRRRATQTTESRCEPRFEIFQSINWGAYSTRWRDLWRWELHSSGLSADLWPVYVTSMPSESAGHRFSTTSWTPVMGVWTAQSQCEMDQAALVWPQRWSNTVSDQTAAKGIPKLEENRQTSRNIHTPVSIQLRRIKLPTKSENIIYVEEWNRIV